MAHQNLSEVINISEMWMSFVAIGFLSVADFDFYNLAKKKKDLEA